jgi:tRNA(Arg) A34 adenosine deaminase TadA
MPPTTQRWPLSGGAFYRAKGSTIYVARVNQTGAARMARPCPNCYEALLLAGVKKVVYTTNEGDYKIEKISWDNLLTTPN